jgi:hypothetical protein
MYTQNIASYERAKVIPGFYTKQELRGRGWFYSTIDEVMPSFDQSLPNPLKPFLEPIYYYRIERVHQLEKSAFFIDCQNAILDKAAEHLRQWGIARHPFVDEVPQLLNLQNDYPTIEALNRDVAAYIQMRLRDMEPSKITEDLRAELAVQILMETFEPRLWQLESYFFHPDYLVTVESVIHQLLKGIYATYPALLFGCYRFALRNFFNFQPNK